MNTIARQTYLDWLRIFSIAGVLVLHSAMPYVAEETWHIKDSNTSMLLLYLVSFLHLFRMPLLFFISGTVSYYMMQRKTAIQFIGLRITRLLIPLLVGIFIIVPPQIYMERLTQGYHGSYWEFYKTVFQFKPYPMGGSFSWHHLWFIGYLFIYDIIFAPFFMWMMSPKSNTIKQAIAWLSKGQRIFLLMVPSVVWFSLLSGKFPETADLIHDGCYFVYWLSFVLAGFTCILVPSLMDSLQRNRRFFMGIGFISLLFFYYRWMNAAGVSDGGHHPVQAFLHGTVRPLVAWTWVFGLVGYGKQYLNRTHPSLQYLNQAVYPFYILHQTVIVILAYYFTRLSNEPALIKYIFTVGITFFITICSFHFFIRPYTIVRFMFGMKTRETDVQKKTKRPAETAMVITENRLPEPAI